MGSVLGLVCFLRPVLLLTHEEQEQEFYMLHDADTNTLH